MKRAITRIIIAAVAFLAGTAFLIVPARSASADDALYNWTVRDGSETCGGKCSPTGMCCRITIVIPN